jgi:diaminohydroxyphosphoribosylaminopyrimidine deaminase/5-amino-6-(5-phosphoribosylamino)uracil reductase
MAWETILKIKEEIKKQSGKKDQLLIPFSPLYIKHRSKGKRKSYIINLRFSNAIEDHSKADIDVHCPDPFVVKIKFNTPLLRIFKQIFELYVPYAVLPYFAVKLKKTFVVTHFAQTLDGRIASVTGDSKWIGNQENLVHAHRMRALLDGILIGSKTLQSDNPMLTVRHVTGKSPRKILIGGDDLDIKDFHISEDEFISFNKRLEIKGWDYKSEKDKHLYDTSKILKILIDLEIYSIYIEGGSITASSFLSQNTIDQVQIHMAPIILGSGVTGFNFKGAKHLEEAIYFKSFRYQPIGDQMMFIGELK